jgi:hypothetical protein
MNWQVEIQDVNKRSFIEKPLIYLLILRNIFEVMVRNDHKKNLG